MELKETARSSDSGDEIGQGTQQSSSTLEPVPGRVGLQASFMPPNIALIKEVIPVITNKAIGFRTLSAALDKKKTNIY